MLKYASRGKRDTPRVKGTDGKKEEKEKFFKKTSKKYLTREKVCDIIVKLSARAGGEKVIEN